MTLTKSSGETDFGVTLTFAYEYNGDGEVSVKSADESIATVMVDGQQVTIDPVGAGSTTITVSAAAGKLYAATEQTYTVTVNKAKSTISFKNLPSDGYSKTYKEAEVKVEATKEGSTKDITYKYYTDEACTKGETVTQPTNVGTYWVKAMVEEDANYEAASAKAKFTVNRAALTAEMFSFTAPENLTYDKKEKTAKVVAKADGVLQGETIGAITLHYYKDITPVDEAIDAGNYTVKISVAESDNYNGTSDITDETWAFNIAKATIPEQAPWNTQSPYLAGEEIELTAPAISGIENEEVVYETVSVSYGESGQATCPTEPGTYEVTATYQNSKNYEDTEVTTTIEIVAKDEVKATLPADEVVESNGWYRLAEGGDYPVELVAPEGYVFVADGETSDIYSIPEDGIYTYSLKRSAEGLEAVVSHTLSFDNTAPVIPSAPDANSVTTTSATFTLADALSGIASYTVSENGKVIDSYPASQGADKLTYTYNGSPGTTHKLTFKVTDVAGNEAVKEVEFTLESIPYVPSYYDLRFEPNDSVLLSADRTTVIEGSSFTVTAEVAEGYDPETLVVEYKKGRSGSWRTIEPNSNGKYRITNVYNDIYVRASVERLADPTAIDRVGSYAASIRAIGRTVCITAGKPVDMRIIGIGGCVVRAEQLSAGYNEISGLQPGVYVVMLSDGTRSKVMVR